MQALDEDIPLDAYLDLKTKTGFVLPCFIKTVFVTLKTIRYNQHTKHHHTRITPWAL
jgi:hypothetical protein